MKIVHIYHSGFYIELSRCALLFDYFEGVLPAIPRDKPLFVFASHVHQDHFRFSIFIQEQLRAHPRVTYLLSKDIKRKYNRNFFLRQGVTEAQYERIMFLKADEEICLNDDGEESCLNGDGKEADRGTVSEPGRERKRGEREQDCGTGPGKTHGQRIRVQTLHSTDAGVAFIVDADGRHIYHAGDLNWWSWEGETKEDECAMERAYKAEIAKLSGQVFDVACLPLDSRQGERFAWGFDWFMRHVETMHAYPMHYWEDDTVIEKLLSLPCSAPYRDRVQMDFQEDGRKRK